MAKKPTTRKPLPVHRRKRKPNECQINTDIEKSTMDLLTRFCVKTGSKRKAIVELALLRFLNSQRP